MNKRSKESLSHPEVLALTTRLVFSGSPWLPMLGRIACHLELSALTCKRTSHLWHTLLMRSSKESLSYPEVSALT